VAFNYCILIFGVIRFGDVAGQALISLDTMTTVINPLSLYLAYSGMLITALSLFSNVTLSQLSSILVAIMFPGFLGIILPGLQSAEWTTFVSNAGGLFHGTSPDAILSALVTCGPLLLFNMEIQKIVPSVTKLCKFNRSLSRTSIVLGGMIPPLIYTLFVYVSVGSATSMAENQEVFLIFKLTTLIGAAIAAGMSCSEEFESILSKLSFPNKDTKESTLEINKMDAIPVMEDNEVGQGQRYALPAVICAILPPLLIGLNLARSGDEGVVGALDFAGGYITPAFIWVFPALLAWNKIDEQLKNMGENDVQNKNIFSFLGEKVTIASVLMASIGVTCLEVVKDFGDLSS